MTLLFSLAQIVKNFLFQITNKTKRIGGISINAAARDCSYRFLKLMNLRRWQVARAPWPFSWTCAAVRQTELSEILPKNNFISIILIISKKHSKQKKIGAIFLKRVSLIKLNLIFFLNHLTFINISPTLRITALLSISIAVIKLTE